MNKNEQITNRPVSTATCPYVIATEEQREQFYFDIDEPYAFVLDGAGSIGVAYIVWMDENGEIWAQRPADEDDFARNHRDSVTVDFDSLPLPLTVIPAHRARTGEEVRP